MILAATTDLVQRLGLSKCVTHTEIRMTPAGPRVLEFALRPIGYPGPLCVSRTTGVDLLGAMVDVANGRPISAVAPTSREKPGEFAGWRYVTVKREGVLARVDGLETARSVSGVIDVDVWGRPGELLLLPPNGFNYIKGYVAATGLSFLDVEQALLESGEAIDLVLHEPTRDG